MNNNITYTRCGDYFIPDFGFSKTPNQKPLGKYGRMRKLYLKEHKSHLWNALNSFGASAPGALDIYRKM